MAEDDGSSSKENPEPGSVVSAAVDPVPGTGSSLAQGSLRGVPLAQLLIWKPDSVIVGAPPQILQRGKAGVSTFPGTSNPGTVAPDLDSGSLRDSSVSLDVSSSLSSCTPTRAHILSFIKIRN